MTDFNALMSPRFTFRVDFLDDTDNQSNYNKYSLLGVV